MSEKPQPRILIADDHGLIRDALPRVIRGRLPGARCEQVATAPDVEAAAAREAWDLVILDLGLPGGGEPGEFDTLRRLRALRPTLPILVLSMFPEEKMGPPALEAGASGYLSKTADRGAIATAVVATLAGCGYMSERLARLIARRREAGGAGHTALSPRELEVLILLGQGLSNKEAAARLTVGVTSVATYRTRILEKLHLHTTADLVRYAVEHRLIRG